MGKDLSPIPKYTILIFFETEFDFKRKGEGDGFENQKLFLIRYTNDMDVKVVDRQ